MGDYLVRLRADPCKVRVGVRRVIDKWRATVTVGGVSIMAYHQNPEESVAIALTLADGQELAGIDLHMQWAYPHPQRVNKSDASNVEPKQGDK